MRYLANYDVNQYERVLDWPIREALIAFRAQVRREAFMRHAVRVLRWAVLAPHTKDRVPEPKPPTVLTEDG